jgi:3-hydroxyisobutyrate dehydrogenase-like beta-hydroxyacid dehydrogenase
MTQSVGVIGLGAMGSVIATHLLNKNFDVFGYDIEPKRGRDLVKLGLNNTTSITAVANQAEILISSLPSFEALQLVIAEICKVEKKNQILLETSTMEVSQKIMAEKYLIDSDKIFLDSPISGTTPLVRAMKGSVFVGGDKHAYNRCVPIINTFTATNYYVGSVGDSSKMKYLANYLVFVHTVAAAECLTLGQKAGLDPGLIHETLKSSAGSSRMFEQRGEMMAKSDYRDGAASVFSIYEKDAAIITKFAAEIYAPIDLFVSARQKYNSASALNLDHLELAAVCRAIEISAGINRDIIQD